MRLFNLHRYHRCHSKVWRYKSNARFCSQLCCSHAWIDQLHPVDSWKKLTFSWSVTVSRLSASSQSSRWRLRRFRIDCSSSSADPLLPLPAPTISSISPHVCRETRVLVYLCVRGLGSGEHSQLLHLVSLRCHNKK